MGILFNDPKSIRFGYPAFIFHLSNDYQFDIAQNVFLFILKTKIVFVKTNRKFIILPAYIKFRYSEKATKI